MPRPKTSYSPMKIGNKSVFSTTEGRKHFPDFIQESYGSKSIVGFDRYGRFLGALVPPEAVLLLAGGDAVKEMDEYLVLRIREHARKLIRELDARNELDDEDMGVSIEDVDEMHSKKKSGN